MLSSGTSDDVDVSETVHTLVHALQLCACAYMPGSWSQSFAVSWSQCGTEKCGLASATRLRALIIISEGSSGARALFLFSSVNAGTPSPSWKNNGKSTENDGSNVFCCPGKGVLHEHAEKTQAVARPQHLVHAPHCPLCPLQGGPLPPQGKQTVQGREQRSREAAKCAKGVGQVGQGVGEGMWAGVG